MLFSKLIETNMSQDLTYHIHKWFIKAMCTHKKNFANFCCFQHFWLKKSKKPHFKFEWCMPQILVALFFVYESQCEIKLCKSRSMKHNIDIMSYVCKKKLMSAIWITRWICTKNGRKFLLDRKDKNFCCCC